MAEPRILVAIDFGTTFTGVAYRSSWAQETDKAKIITTWDDNNGDGEKVDTAVSFGNSSSQMSTWGVSATLEDSPIRWFKLLLIDEEDLPGEVRNSEQVKTCRKQLRDLNKTPVEIISFYLRNLWNHCLDLITRDIGKALVNVSRFHIILTLPAIWPQYARNRMQQAAKMAGLIQQRLGGETRLSFVSEPEAAALATLADMEKRPDLKADDTFIVVDCGGGTVDIITYKIISAEPKLSIQECVQGQGALCGAVFVDNDFIKLLEEKFGQSTFKRISASDLAEIMRRDWQDGIRYQFKGQHKKWTIRQPYDSIDASVKRAGGGQPKITITSDDIRRVFAPSIKKIQKLLLDQIGAVREKKLKDPKFAILVGGFGRCGWLHQCLQAGSGGIEVLQSSGSGPWTAICRGAVIHALRLENLSGRINVQIQSRVARTSFGVVFNQAWDDTKHNLRDKYWCDIEGKWKAANQLRWFIRVGDDVSERDTVSHDFYRLFDSNPDKAISTIRMSRSASPPIHKDSSVIQFCKITWDYSVDISSLPPVAAPSGKIWSRLNYQIAMTCTGGSIEVDVIHAGKKQASKNISLDFQDHGDIAN